jgi:hypothetical protein
MDLPPDDTGKQNRALGLAAALVRERYSIDA